MSFSKDHSWQVLAVLALVGPVIAIAGAGIRKGVRGGHVRNLDVAPTIRAPPASRAPHRDRRSRGGSSRRLRREKIPMPAVVIRELRSNGSHMWRTGRVVASAGPRESGSPIADTYVSIAVDSIVPGAATIIVNNAYSASPAALGEWCGEKSRGQVRACAAGLQCDARRTGQLVSIDWFCQ